MHKRKTVVIILLLTVGGTVFAQSERETLRERVENALSASYHMVSYDTLYVGRPESKLMLKVTGNLTGNTISGKNSGEGYHTHTHLSTKNRGTLSFDVSYYGLSAGFSLNPAQLKGHDQDFEVDINAFSNKYSLDFSYQKSKTLSGRITANDESYYLDKSYLTMKIINMAGYYTFNHRRFSYAAPFTQAYTQKRSAGSWLAGFSFLGARIKTTNNVPENTPRTRINVANFAIGGGYGYNFVHRNWLFHASALPTIIVYNSTYVKYNDKKINGKSQFPDMIINGRAALVYSFSPRYFVGSTYIVHSALFSNHHHKNRQEKWHGQVFFGLRL